MSECPYCHKEINLKKKKTIFQKIEEKAINFTNPYKKFMPKHKDYWCSCGAHITLINPHKKQKEEWVVITSSKS